MIRHAFDLLMSDICYHDCLKNKQHIAVSIETMLSYYKIVLTYNLIKISEFIIQKCCTDSYLIIQCSHPILHFIVAYHIIFYCECRDDIRQSGEECHRVNKRINKIIVFPCVCCSFITPRIFPFTKAPTNI